MIIGKKCSFIRFDNLIKLDTPVFNPQRPLKDCFKIKNIFPSRSRILVKPISIKKAIWLQRKI